MPAFGILVGFIFFIFIFFCEGGGGGGGGDWRGFVRTRPQNPKLSIINVLHFIFSNLNDWRCGRCQPI